MRSRVNPLGIDYKFVADGNLTISRTAVHVTTCGTICTMRWWSMLNNIIYIYIHIYYIHILYVYIYIYTYT